MKKRIISAILVSLMALTALAGCNNAKPATATSPATAVAPASAASNLPKLKDNVLKFSASVPTFGTDPAPTAVQKEWIAKMEAYLGCKLDIAWTYTPWADYRANEKVILASGVLPDVFTYSQGDVINQYGADGQVLNIAKYKDNMKYYKDFISGTVGKESFAFNEDGTGYIFRDGFVNTQNITGAQSFTAFAYRFDILQKNNLVPATTLDEFDALCAKLKELYPSNYPISNSDKNYAFYRGFVGIFHTWDTLYWNSKEWAYGPIEANFKEMLKYMKTLNDKGYLDPEFATDDSNAATKKATTGKTFIYPTLWAGMAGHWNKNKEDQTINFGLAYLPSNPKIGTPWKWGSKADGTCLVNNGFGVAISAKTQNPEWLVKLVDYQYSPEMVELQNWGIKDKTYTVDAKGNKVFTDEILKADNSVQALANYGVTSSASCRTGIVFTPQDFIPQVTQIKPEPWWSKADGYHDDKYWLASSKYGGPESICPQDRAPVVRLTADEATKRATLITSSDTIAKEHAIKFIKGELDIDKEWDNYVKKIKLAVEDFDGTMGMLNKKTVK